MIYTVNYTKKNNFIRPSGGNPARLKQVSNDGETLIDKHYKLETTPKSRKIHRIKWNSRIKKYDVGIKPEELNELVSSLDFYDKNNVKIVKANARNQSDPFFGHKDLYLSFDRGSVILNDEIPIDRFWLAALNNDIEFKQLGDEINPAITGKVKYTVFNSTVKAARENKVVDESMEASDIFHKGLDDNKRIKILKAFGVYIDNPDSDVVKRTLFSKITTDKDVINRATGERNVELFLRLAKTNTEELNIRAFIQDARGKGFITKGTNNKYQYRDVSLGRTLNDAYNFLSEDINSDLLEDVINDLKPQKKAKPKKETTSKESKEKTDKEVENGDPS